jgi:MYXO-CTERM domain-containing protein
MRSRLGRVLLAVLTSAAVLLNPGVAAAEGPGYGGSADRLNLKWKADKGRRLVVYAVGFRGGSAVVLRLGSGAEQTAYADQAGALRVDVGSLAGDRLASGASVFAVGKSPSGTALRLVGNVPPEPSGRGPLDYLGWILTAVFGLLGVGGFAGRRRRSRANPDRPAEQPAKQAAAQPAGRAASRPTAGAAGRPARRGRAHGSKR